MRRKNAILRLDKNSLHNGPAVPGVRAHAERNSDDVGENVVRTLMEEPWQLVLAAAFLTAMLLMPVISWWLGYD